MAACPGLSDHSVCKVHLIPSASLAIAETIRRTEEIPEDFQTNWESSKQLRERPEQHVKTSLKSVKRRWRQLEITDWSRYRQSMATLTIPTAVKHKDGSQWVKSSCRIQEQ